MGGQEAKLTQNMIKKKKTFKIKTGSCQNTYIRQRDKTHILDIIM